jgi:hypothetical protein
LIPARGKVLVKRIETEETLGGGKILIPDSAREAMSAYQMRVISVGQPEHCRDIDECSRLRHGAAFRPADIIETSWGSCSRPGALPDYWHPVDEYITPDAWVIVSPRKLVETDQPNQYLVQQSDIQGVFVEQADTEAAILK